MNFFDFLAERFLNRTNEYVCLKNFGKDNWFGFIYRGYDRIMSMPKYGSESVNIPKEGYFDIFICT